MDADYRSPHDGRPAQDPKETSTTADAAPEGPRRRGNRHHAFRGKNRVRKGPRTEQPATPTSAEMLAARPSGRTPGTSTAYEPAAAPLGTDDEAAGTPPRPQDLEREIQRAARGGGMQGLPADEAMSGRPGQAQASAGVVGKLAAIAAAVVILGVIAVLLF